MLNRAEIRGFTWPLENIPLVYLQNSWVAFAVCFGSSSICTMKRRSINFAAFD